MKKFISTFNHTVCEKMFSPHKKEYNENIKKTSAKKLCLTYLIFPFFRIRV